MATVAARRAAAAAAAGRRRADRRDPGGRGATRDGARPRPARSGPALDAHRRREAELSALVDTARDLASPARPRRRPRRHRAPGPHPARHRRRLPDPVRRGRAATPTCGRRTARCRRGSSRCGCRLGRRARRARRADPPALLDAPTTRRPAVPAHRARSTPRSATRAWSRSAARRCSSTAQFVGVLFASNRTRAAVLTTTRWRCSARWPRWPPCRSCRPGPPPDRGRSSGSPRRTPLSRGTRGHRAGGRGARPVRRLVLAGRRASTTSPRRWASCRRLGGPDGRDRSPAEPDRPGAGAAAGARRPPAAARAAWSTRTACGR